MHNQCEICGSHMYNYCGNRISILQWYLEYEPDGLDRYLQQLCKFRVVKGLKQNNLRPLIKIYRTEISKSMNK